MRMYDIIHKKRDGYELTSDEIRYFINSYTLGKVPDAQAAALLMAFCMGGMSKDETIAFTMALARSGDVVDLSSVNGPTADKHSTGGVGDKTSLIVAPIAAAIGCKVVKMAGRGLGHTGGTVDKLESIPGFKTEMDPTLFISQINRIGIGVISQSGKLAPADRKIYLLRDETATLDNKGLIASSILSKKVAGGSSNIVVDVKYGSGAFMKTREDAVELAEIMVDIGTSLGKKMTAVISNMDIPLGRNIGNSLEVIEAIDILNGEGSEDLRELSLVTAALMHSSCFDSPYEESLKIATEALDSGAALEKMRQLVRSQFGDVSLVDHPECFETSRHKYEVKAFGPGFVSSMDTEAIGKASRILGAGRLSKDSALDYNAGIILHKKPGDHVEEGDVLCELRTGRQSSIRDAEEVLRRGITISNEAPAKEDLIYKIIKA